VNRSRLLAATIVVAVLIGAGAFLAGRLSSGATATPSTESAAAGFLRDMQVHHAQAVDMAMTIRDSSTDPDLRRLAYDIALGQSNQAGQMYGLLESWGLSQASGQPPMTWMSQPVLDGASGDHGHTPSPDGTMPGMASMSACCDTMTPFAIVTTCGTVVRASTASAISRPPRWCAIISVRNSRSASAPVAERSSAS
jgi:hypothetical protein